MVFTVQEAKSQLGKLLDLARSGEEVIITRHGKTVAKLVAAGDEGPAKRGEDSMKGEIPWKEGWEKSMAARDATPVPAAVGPAKLRTLGAMKGEITYREGWDKALTDEEADAFWEGRW